MNSFHRGYALVRCNTTYCNVTNCLDYPLYQSVVRIPFCRIYPFHTEPPYPNKALSSPTKLRHSQENSPLGPGFLPKCPYDEVLSYIGRKRFKCLMIPLGEKSIA